MNRAGLHSWIVPIALALALGGCGGEGPPNVPRVDTGGGTTTTNLPAPGQSVPTVSGTRITGGSVPGNPNPNAGNFPGTAQGGFAGAQGGFAGAQGGFAGAEAPGAAGNAAPPVTGIQTAPQLDTDFIGADEINNIENFNDVQEFSDIDEFGRPISGRQGGAAGASAGF